jgi:Zn-dependent protease
MSLAERLLAFPIVHRVGLQPVGIRDINATEYALRQERMSRLDFSFLGDVVPPPEFTKEEISKFKDTFDVSKWRTEIVDRVAQSPTFQNMDEEDLIRKVMEQEYYFNEITKKFGVSASDDMNQDFMSGLRKELEKTQPYATIESIFPKCVEKEGQIPTEVQVKMLMSDVLPQAGFSPSSKPIEVFGGYLIRGESKKDNGDDLIDSIDRALLKNPMLRGKFTVTYLKDLSGVMGISDEEFEEIVFSSIPKALYVMGPEVSRPRPRGLLTAVSALGIGTSWYLSIYPFLLNPDIMNKAEEQLALADASMAYDLSWLTDLSIPLFATFMGLQAFHELGHRAVAGAYGLNITLPTFVPSLASGITSSITNFKQPAKNRQQLFDFAIAGPLVGIVASLIALYGGLLLTVNGDPTVTSTFPALPLEILRQSSLAGGFIEAVLGNGVLNVPEAARGSQVVASINIPLHPVAIAGYISLVVNSLSMLPIGGEI